MAVADARPRSARAARWRGDAARQRPQQPKPQLGPLASGRSVRKTPRRGRSTWQTLEQQLEELLDQETFSPPEGFKEQAVVSDDAIYEQAEDYEAFWAERAEALHWDTKWDQVLDWSNPPFAKWFVGGKLNVSYNCVDRHVEAGNGDRVAYHWRGEEGEELDVTYADLHRDVQKFANALKDARRLQGRRRRDLPADDPRGRGGDARLRAHRRDPQRRLRRLQRRVGQGADRVLRGQDLITVDGARRKGKTAPIKETVDEVIGDLVDTIVVVERADNDAPMKDGRDHSYARAARGRRRRVPGRADGRRGPALHPLHERLDGQAEGHPAHHRRLPDRRRVHARRRCSTSSPRRTSTGARPTSAGSPGTATSSTGRWPTARPR